MLGHETQGNGPNGVIVINDWMCDTSTWDGARAYLGDASLTWAFADLRGYGRSREISGIFTVEEAASDVMALADHLGWHRFHIVGHSMSTLVALHLAQGSGRVARAVVVTPPPPTGFGYNEATLDAVRGVAMADDERREHALRSRLLGDRLSDGWLRFKLRRWRERATPTAVEGYVAMFGRRGLPDPSAHIACPVLAVTGEMDAEVMREKAATAALSPLCRDLTVVPFSDCGHYPMQESPPRFATVVEGFLTRG